MDHQRAVVDTARPFRSVKEAVAVFGERILAGELHSHKSNIIHEVTKKPPLPPPVPLPYPPSSPSPSSLSFSSLPRNGNTVDDTVMAASIKRLEEELEETKKEVMLLKERESEMEMVVASLDEEIRKDKSTLEGFETAASGELSENNGGGGGGGRCGRDNVMNYGQYLPTLAHMMSLGEIEYEFEEEDKKERRRMVRKKKPIVPLVGDMFSSMRKKSGSFKHHPTIYSPPFSGVLC